MEAHAVRFPSTTWDAVQIEAAAADMAASEFIREAALARAVASYQARGATGNAPLDAILGAPQRPAPPRPSDPITGYVGLARAAKDALGADGLVARERADLMQIFRMAEARGGLTRRS